MEAQVILENCRIESEANPAIAKANIYDGVIKAYFAEYDRTHQTTFGEIEECYMISDHKRKLCRELIAELEKESFDGVAGIINALNARIVFLIDTPAYIAEQISAHKTDIKAEYEHFRKWTKGYDFDFTKAVFEQLKGKAGLCRTLANELTSSVDEDVKDTEQSESFKTRLSAYLKRIGISENEQPEPRKAGRPKGTERRELSDFLVYQYQNKISELKKYLIAKPFTPKSMAMITQSLLLLNVIDNSMWERSAFFKTFDTLFGLSFTYSAFNKQLNKTINGTKNPKESHETQIYVKELKAVLGIQ